MHRSIRLLAAALFSIGLTAAGAGCQSVKTAFSGPSPVVSYHAGSQPVEAKAITQGMYVLYAVGDSMPRVKVNLQQNQDVGFRRNPDGQLFAIAGDQTFPLPDNHDYYWKQE